VAFQAAAFAAYGVKDARDTVAYLVFHDIPYEQRRDVYPDYRIHQVHPVECAGVEAGGKQQLYLLYQPVEHEGRYGGEQAYQETQYQRELAIGNILFAQPEDTLRHGSLFGYGVGVIVV